MSIAEQVTQLKTDFDGVYEAGYNKGKSEGGDNLEDNPLHYISVKDFQWYGVTFPDGFDFVLNVKTKPASMNAMLSGAKGLKSAMLICEAEGTVSYAQLVRESTVEVLDLTKFKPIPTLMNHFAYLSSNLISILGALNLSECTNVSSAFASCTSLTDIEFVPNTIPITISFANSPNLSDASIASIIDGLIMLPEGAASRSLTLHQAVRNKLSTTQVDTIKNVKGWSLLPAEATN